MITVYLSHPFTGNEATNRLRARSLAAYISQCVSDIYILNPLDALQYMEQTETEYFQILQICKKLLWQCDAVYLAGGWQESNGCRMEKQYAETLGLPIVYSVEGLTKALQGKK